VRLMLGSIVAASLCLSAAHAQEMSPMLHNGSIMLITTDDKERVEIKYETPRAGLSVTTGTLLFAGTRDAKGNYAGTAYTFKRDCEPAPYGVMGMTTAKGITLVGVAPHRDPQSCKVLGGSMASRSSRLVFEYEPE
jgi:hypothetical protein